MSITELKPEQLRLATPPERFSFHSTAEVDPADTIIGQPRGLRAIEFGVDIDSPGFNVFVLGPSGTGRTSTIERYLRARAAHEPVPEDWVYVNNFARPEEPRNLSLPAGMGAVLADDMKALIEQLRREIARALDSEPYVSDLEKLRDEVEDVREELIRTLETQARASNFDIVRSASGMDLVPTRDGQPLSDEDIRTLPEAEQREIESARRILSHEVDTGARTLRTLETNARDRERQLERTVAATIVDAALAGLKTRYQAYPETVLYLDQVREDVLNHVADFRSTEDDEHEATPATQAPGEAPAFRRYMVNVLVDHSGQQGAPVIVEDHPNLVNLVGRIEHEVRLGSLATDFSLIRPGALHRANGGYLVIQARQLLVDPPAWQALKRALLNGKVKTEDLDPRISGAPATVGLDPEPIPLHVKVILVGEPDLYYGLYTMEEDFRKLFKVKVDFATDMDRTPENEWQIARFIAARCQNEHLAHFDPTGVARVVEFAAWLASDQQRLSTRFGALADLIREAAYWRKRNGHDLVTASDVDQAVRERIYRSNLYEELTLDEITDGVVHIDTQGTIVGQVNGLVVIDVGDYEFGLPTRISARTFLGRSGIVNIEREVELSDPIHDKGVLTLNGYLGGQYAQDIPLTLSAQITFEQDHSQIGGDSASAGELFALLSSLAELPIRQDIAVTGAISQHGEIQPIGGVTQKVEGFFAICQSRGLTGTQGVIIPASNVRHLMVRPEIVAAVAAGQFHVWSMTTVDQGLELLTGIPAGQLKKDGNYLPGTIHHAVLKRLRDMAERLRTFEDADSEEEASAGDDGQRE